MSVEVALFLGLAGLSVIAAVAMLISENAVHSALFLIVNFAAVAVLYILLDASFLAMVQIAVYAGAIMVLFLFVIMLLNAEQVGGEGIQQFRWLSPLALTLALSFLIAISAAFSAGGIDGREVPDAAPLVRVAHFAPAYTDPVDIYLNDALAVSGLEFGETSSFTELAPGEYSIGLGIPGTQNVLPLSDVLTVEEGQSTTVVAYGEGRIPLISAVQEDLTAMMGREGRVLFFNAYTAAPAVDLLDPGPDFILNPDETLEFYTEELPFGTASEIDLLNEGETRVAVVASDNPDALLARLEDFEVERSGSHLIAVVSAPDAVNTDGALQPELLAFATDTFAPIGSPRAIGQALFSRYVLPFQMVAMLLLAAMVGAIVLTQRTEVKPKPGRPTRRKVSRPLTSVIASQTGHDVTEVPERPQLEAPEEQPEPSGD